ncbi:hypothetical protein [Rhizorhapis sp. SPR117]|uniref:hypothetical protein n=1 Tax=Rhizorhapis sp. SPR117 TaxID=2912611 RepID=UPI001F412BC5|nr:hypothetical protein [Rhizorhapis sp. SPR117]
MKVARAQDGAIAIVALAAGNPRFGEGEIAVLTLRIGGFRHGVHDRTQRERPLPHPRAPGFPIGLVGQVRETPPGIGQDGGVVRPAATSDPGGLIGRIERLRDHRSLSR